MSRSRAVLLALIALSASRLAMADAAGDLLARFDGEPSVRELQDAAARNAQVHPELVRSWLARVRIAALAPQLQLHGGLGTRVLQTVTGADGFQRVTVGDGSTWTVGASARWTLDRLVFDREELRLSREAQRVAARRESLLTDVAHLYFERRRLQVALALEPPSRTADTVDARLQIDELGAMLDGLTGGALSRSQGGR